MNLENGLDAVLWISPVLPRRVLVWYSFSTLVISYRAGSAKATSKRFSSMRASFGGIPFADHLLGDIPWVMFREFIGYQSAHLEALPLRLDLRRGPEQERDRIVSTGPNSLPTSGGPQGRRGGNSSCTALTFGHSFCLLCNVWERPRLFIIPPRLVLDLESGGVYDMALGQNQWYPILG